MPFFRYRPLALYCLAFCTAVCCAELFFVRLSAPLLIIAAVLFSLLFALFLAFRKKRFSRFFLRPAVCVIFALLGLFAHFALAYLPEKRLTENEGECDVTVLIEEKLYDSFAGTAYKARVMTVNGERSRGRVLYTSPDGTLESGDVVITAVVFSPSDASDKRDYLRSNGMVASADTADGAIVLTTENRITPHSVSARLRNVIAARIERASEGKDGGICAALLVGMRDGISDIAYLDLTRAGILHMLAISGMHFTVLMGAVGFLLHKMKLPKAARIVILFFCAAFYTAAAGFSYSVLRAAIMLFAVYISYFLKRERDVYTSLFASSALILAFEPTAASSVGLWLSVFATAGVIFASELYANAARKKNGKPLGFFGGTVLMPLFISLCAQTCTLPIVFTVYGTVSPAAAIATLLCSLPVNILLFASVLLAVVGTPIPFVTEAVSAVCRLLFGIAAFFSDNVPPYSLSYRFTPYIVLAVLTLSCLAMLTAKRTRRVFSVLAAVSLLAFPVCTAAYETPRRDVVSVGIQSQKQSDVLVFSSAEGSVIVDMTNGSKRAVSCAESILGKLHRTDADILVITRLSNSAVNAIVNYGTAFKVRKVYYPAQQGDGESDITEQLIENASAIRAEAVEYRFGEDIEAAGVSLCIHSEIAEHSTVPMRAVGAAVGDERILYVSSGITHSEYIKEIREAAANADMLIIGASGPKNKLLLHFTAKCPTILPSKEIYGSLSEPYKTLLDGIEVHYSDDALIFDVTAD